MAEYAFVKSHTPSTLHTEFDVAHPGRVKTIRSKGGSPTTPAVSGTVVHDGIMTNAQIQTVIDDHVPS